MEKDTIPQLDLARLRKVDNVDFIDNDFAIFKDFPTTTDLTFPFRLQSMVFALTLRGRISFVLNTHEYHIGADQLVILMSEHIIDKFETSPDFSALFIAVSPEFIQDCIPHLESLTPMLLYAINHPTTTLSPEEVSRIAESHELLWKRTRLFGHPYRKEITRTILTSVFYDVAGIFSKHQELSGKQQSRRNEVFSKFIKLVSEHCAAQHSVAFYAEKLCLSPKYLSTTIKDVSGRTALEWITDYVTLEAKTLLSNTNLSIQEIAFRLNFPRQTFFGKYFKHVTGQTPGKYRKSH